MVRRRIEGAVKRREKEGLKMTRLQEARISCGFSQGDLSSKSGVTVRMIQQYEQGKRSIDGARLSTLCALCVALDCNIEDILEDQATIRIYKRVK